MSFYGNITNVNKTQFSFDRIYHNRKEMEDKMSEDSIYLGRYVLVEYGNGFGLDIYTKLFVVKNADGIEEFHITDSNEADTLVRWTNKPADPTSSNLKGEGNAVLTDQLIYVTKDTTPDDGKNNPIDVFYKCINDPDTSHVGDIAIFELVTKKENAYTTNYNIDMSKYGAGRGYDSTVWQKVYANNTEKYVMIAELNSVVPTFALTADAPTMTPVTPHFDTDSTNVYYKLHWQPQWGLRVAAAADHNSDAVTTHESVTYDPISGKTTTITDTNIPAAINFNGPAFNPQIGEPIDNIKKKDNTENYFTILPTGKSGQVYNTHDGTGELRSVEDVQEMRINLPAIGNMMSDAWDIIHGPNRDDARTDENGSLQGRLNSFKDIGGNQIPVKRSNDGTLVGTNINGNTSRTVTDITKESLHIDDKTRDDAWIKTVIDTNGLTDAKNSNNNGISIHHTFTSTPDTTSASNKNTDGVASNNASDKIELYTPYVDAAGHVVGKNVETVTLPYGFKTIATNGRGEDTDTANDGEMLKQEAIIADNTQDALNINSGNKWVRIDMNSNSDTITISHDIHNFNTDSAGHTNLNTEDGAAKEENLTIYDWDYDNAGHITKKQAHTYTLPFGYKTITPGSASEAVAEIESNTTSLVANETQDTLTIAPGNKWVRVAGVDDTFIVAHEVHDIDNKPIENATKLDGGAGTFTIQDIAFDEAGHAKSNKAHTYNLPNAIRNIKIGNNSTVAAGSIPTQNEGQSDEEFNASLRVDATTYNDTLNLNAQNRWITLNRDKNNKTITIGHAAAGEASLEANTEGLNNSAPKFGESFNVLTMGVDEVGHVKKLSSYSITLPTPSINELTTTNASVVTSISMESDTGAITQTNANVGSLLLTGYTAKDGADATYVASTDTMNAAFRKVDDRLDAEIERAKKAESDEATRAKAAEEALDNRLNAILDGVTEEELNTLKELSDALNDDENYAATVTKAIADEKTARETAIASEASTREAQVKSLAQAVEVEVTERVTAINQLVALPSHGITTDDITKWNSLKTNVQADWDATEGAAVIKNKPTNLVTEEQIEGVVKENSEFVYTPAEEDAETGEEITPAETQTIVWLFEKVKELEGKLIIAEQKIEELEKYHTTTEEGDNEEGTSDPETPTT